MIFLNIHLLGLLAAIPIFIEGVAVSPPGGPEKTVSWCLLVWSLCWRPRATGGHPASQPHRVEDAGSSPAVWSCRTVWDPSLRFEWRIHDLIIGLVPLQTDWSSPGRLWSDRITARANAPLENLASSFDYNSSWSWTSFDLIPNTPQSKVKLNLIWLQFKTPQSERCLITDYSCSSTGGSVLLRRRFLVFVFRTSPSFKHSELCSSEPKAWLI